MSPVAGSAARERLLVCAEHLFSERGYTAVTLRDVAEAVGIRQASLYHHFPGGKEQLFVAVTEFGLARISTELIRVAADTHTLSLSERLERIALLLLDQPPIDLARMVRSDMPAIAGDVAERLTRRAFDSLIIPIGTVFKEQRHDNDLLLAGWFLAMIESVQVAERFARRPASLMANEMIDVLIYGVAQRSR
jgi:AcrR family transcriptional regulator